MREEDAMPTTARSVVAGDQQHILTEANVQGPPAGQFPRLMELSTGQALQLETPLLPGFALSVDDLFAPV